jgi:hypothetical protein
MVTMLADFITRVAWRFPRKVLYGAAGPYLTRFTVLKSRYLNVYIHCFHRSPQPHNHPWKVSASLIVSGGYREERRTRGDAVQVKDFYPGAINVIRANDYHRVDLHVPETWTVFVSGPRVRLCPVEGYDTVEQNVG